ncbi:redoxin domain-containing protein [Maribacter sp. 2304DJ31-5]|uniref:redoxin domain-containing protein n=1 Tax=Maribacter sp. 2304DJ31-5 TaxID=3386273 RepID=UPI0039BC2901
MKELLFVSILILSNFNVFGQKEKNMSEVFELSGEITNDYSGYLYLRYGNKLDSTLVENKTFSFKGKVDYPTESLLLTKNGVSSGEPLYIENSKITVNVSVNKNITTINSIEGTKTALIMSDLQSYYQKIQSDSDFTAKLYKKLDTIITQNPRNQFSGMVLSDIITDPILSYQQASNLFNKLDLTTQRDDEINSIKASLLKLKNIRVGATIKDFELPNIKGEYVNTKDFKNNILLIEFWASWCVPCRQDNPKLVNIYGEYKEKGFEIYGVSLDIKKESWNKAIKDDNLYWTQTIAEGGFNNEIIKTFGIQAIPANFLIDNNGKILAINIKPIELEKKLIKLLGK